MSSIPSRKHAARWAIALLVLAQAAAHRLHRRLRQEHELHEEQQPVLELRWSSGAYELPKTDADMEPLYR
jgi:hypothetical protein